ncbi:unnamed protein product [Xylocopa violacea]|uniref:Uncharacterized protein n=1 Tax=Xylocopa violacea TaxID=135666 RepID=A0ABP1NQA7_XYLVO
MEDTAQEPHASLCPGPTRRWSSVGANRLWATKPIWYTCPSTLNLDDPPLFGVDGEPGLVTKDRHALARDRQWDDFRAPRSLLINGVDMVFVDWGSLHQRDSPSFGWIITFDK